jgi:hypothetical protein
MARLTKLQLIGPLAVFMAVLSAELATSALAHFPASEMLWRINVAWFQAFQKSSYAIDAFEAVSYSQFWIVAVPLFSLAIGGVLLGRPLLVATASNLSFVYACIVLYADYLYNRPWQSRMIIPSAPEYLLCYMLVALSFLSFLVSHFYYIRAIRGGSD